MSDKRNLTEYIDAFLDATLTDAEKDEFQQKMLEDSVFRLEVEAQSVVRSLVAKNEKRAYFSHLEEELFNTTALIDRYLEGNMSGSELQWFEQRLEEDDELRQDLAAQRMIIKAAQRQEVKKKFQDLEKEIDSSKEDEQEVTPVIPFYRRKRVWLAIAASVAILISIAAVFIIDRSQNQPIYALESDQEQLIARYSISVDVIGTTLRSQPWDVSILKSKKYPLHYVKQNETLILYLEDPALSKEDIQIEEDPSAEQPYKLILKDQAYLLEDTSVDPQPLEAIE